jgi:hypothetical protein
MYPLCVGPQGWVPRGDFRLTRVGCFWDLFPSRGYRTTHKQVFSLLGGKMEIAQTVAERVVGTFMDNGRLRGPGMCHSLCGSVKSLTSRYSQRPCWAVADLKRSAKHRYYE